MDQSGRTRVCSWEACWRLFQGSNEMVSKRLSSRTVMQGGDLLQPFQQGIGHSHAGIPVQRLVHDRRHTLNPQPSVHISQCRSILYLCAARQRLTLLLPRKRLRHQLNPTSPTASPSMPLHPPLPTHPTLIPSPSRSRRRLPGCCFPPRARPTSYPPFSPLPTPESLSPALPYGKEEAHPQSARTELGSSPASHPPLPLRAPGIRVPSPAKPAASPPPPLHAKTTHLRSDRLQPPHALPAQPW